VSGRVGADAPRRLAAHLEDGHQQLLVGRDRADRPARVKAAVAVRAQHVGARRARERRLHALELRGLTEADHLDLVGRAAHREEGEELCGARAQIGAQTRTRERARAAQRGADLTCQSAHPLAPRKVSARGRTHACARRHASPRRCTTACSASSALSGRRGRGSPQ
jgi:hypothetical protein